MKKIIAIGFMSALIGCAIVAGNRAQMWDGMAVVIGVMVGVTASIPVALLVMAATANQRRRL